MKILSCLGLVGALLFAQSGRVVEEFKTKAGVVKITPIRHASMTIEAGGKVIHVDPWNQGNFEGLPKADLILITDIHPDPNSLWQKSWQAEARPTWCRKQLIHPGGAGAFACEPGGMGLLPQAVKRAIAGTRRHRRSIRATLRLQ
jgi:hypothetical protein